VSDALKVLSIDGGGIRGIIPATVLAEIERRTGSRIAQLFDLIAGTSTGGILALGLVRPSDADPSTPHFEAADLAALYEQKGGEIFQRSSWHVALALDNLLGEKYSAQGLELVLDEYFGGTMLSQAVTETLVTSYELETRTPWLFARHKARDPAKKADFPMKFVARATSAAPTYFEPEELATQDPPLGFVDGGVYANNPAYAEARDIHPDADDVLVVSLGTGQLTRPIHFADAKDWGLAHWAKPILDVVFDGVSDTVDHQLGVLCAARGGVRRYFRYQTELTVGSDDMDNVTTTNIQALKGRAEELIESEDASLAELCKELAPVS
jgi:patatin-like phospholipase/acyl hydrolase